MTGYAVLVRPQDALVSPDELRALVPALARRGPHGTSVVAHGALGLVTALLDTGDARLGPAWAKAGRFVVVGQVRVDAREALVDALRAAGTNASGDDPDVRLFAQAWLTWGGCSQKGVQPMMDVPIAFYGEPLTLAFGIGAALILAAMVLSQL